MPSSRDGRTESDCRKLCDIRGCFTDQNIPNSGDRVREYEGFLLGFGVGDQRRGLRQGQSIYSIEDDEVNQGEWRSNRVVINEREEKKTLKLEIRVRTG